MADQMNGDDELVEDAPTVKRMFNLKDIRIEALCLERGHVGGVLLGDGLGFGDALAASRNARRAS